MKNLVGTEVRGIRLPMIKRGDNLREIIVDILLSTQIPFKERDVICITESIVARSCGNYVSVDDIAQEVLDRFGEDPVVGVLWPIYSRNRFSLILKGIARASKKVIIQLGSGKDDVGNDIYNQFTGVNIIEFYKNLVESEGAQCEMYLNDYINTLPDKCTNIIVASTHGAHESVDQLRRIYGCRVNTITLKDLCAKPEKDRGYNEKFGLLGSNKAGDELLKLFPRVSDCKDLVEGVREDILEKTGVSVEVMVYGDGCFKDPVCGIWEFADPVVSPAYTDGLQGTPGELKIKYLLDSEESIQDDLEGGIRKMIREKDKDLKENMLSQGTTPRRYTDLLGSLADLTSGSGDKGTPVVWISGYFRNFGDD